MKMGDFLKRCRAYPFALVVVCLSICLFLFSYFRSFGSSDLDARYDNAVRTWGRMDVNIFKNSVNLETDLESVKGISQDVRSRLIHPAELAKNYQYFFRLESATDIKILSLQQESIPVTNEKDEKKEKKENKPMFPAIPYSLAASGGFEELISFLYALENGEHFYSMKECTLQRDTRSKGEALSMVMQFNLLGTP